MRSEQAVVAWDCARRVVPLFHGVLLTESERAEAFRLVYHEVLAAIEGYEHRRRQEERPDKPVTLGGET